MTAVSAFEWRRFQYCNAWIEHPRRRQPITLLLNDSNPGYNTIYYHSGFQKKYGEDKIQHPRELIEQFADLVERTNIRGKFSVIPYPLNQGRIDDKEHNGQIAGLDAGDVRHFLDIVRRRITPYMDITPEVLTHYWAIDLSIGRTLNDNEPDWSQTQNRQSLTPYLALALEILKNVGLPAPA